MIDVQYLRTELSEVATRLKSRGYNLDTKHFSALEEKRKKMQIYTEQMQAERNQLSKTIGFKKRQNENTEGLQSEVMRLNQELAKNEKNGQLFRKNLITGFYRYIIYPIKEILLVKMKQITLKLNEWVLQEILRFPLRTK